MARPQVEDFEFRNAFVEGRAAKIIKHLEALVETFGDERKREKGDRQLPGWRQLATAEALIFKQQYPDRRPDTRPEEERTYSTCLRQLPQLKKELLKLLITVENPDNRPKVRTTLNRFYEALLFLFSPYRARQNKQYESVLKGRSSTKDRIEVDLTPYLKEAHRILTIASEGGINLKDVDWRDVSIAVAFTSGRRMAEIHLSAEFMETDDPYTLIFSGQLKGKTRVVEETGKALREHEFEIPTLVEARLVKAGLDWLSEWGKRIEDESADPSVVNKRYAKVFTEAIRKKWVIVPDEDWQKLSEGDKMTYHKLRGLYLTAAVANFQGDGLDLLELAPKFLGDADLKAVMPYKRFKIKEGSVTKI